MKSLKVLFYVAFLSILLNSIGLSYYYSPLAHAEESPEAPIDQEISDDEQSEEVVIDEIPPLSSLNSPSGGSVFGSEGIYIEGSSTDVPDTTVDYVTLWGYSYDDDEWFEITTLSNENEEEPFNWSYTWLPDYEGYYDIVAEATDKAGNTDYSENAYAEEVVYDITAPTSQITSPGDNSFWNSPISIEGSSEDSSEIPVDFVSIFYRTSGNEEIEGSWNEIDTNAQEEGTQPLFNENEYVPFEWNYNWTPPEEGIYDIKAEATDKRGNVEESPVASYITYDITNPTSNISYPEEGNRYIEDVWDGQISGTASDSLSDINSVLVSIKRDLDDNYWFSDEESWAQGEDEVLNIAGFDNEYGTWDFDFYFIEPEGDDEGYTIRSLALDDAGNREEANEIRFFFGRAPAISDEDESDVSQSSLTITWSTDFPATSRVVFDTISHSDLGTAPNYGYANSTEEADTDPKVTDHSVLVNGLTSGTTYFYRTVSRGSPEAVSGEHSFSTSAASQSVGGTSIIASTVSGSTPSAPSCNDQKPASAPTLLSAVSGLNSATLTWSEGLAPISYYLIAYGTSSGIQMFGNPNIGGKGTTSFTVNNLSGGTTYYFKVRAGNGCAPGEFSNELSQTPTGGVIEEPAEGFSTEVPNEEASKASSSSVQEINDKDDAVKFDPKVLWIAITILVLLILFILKKFAKIKRFPM